MYVSGPPFGSATNVPGGHVTHLLEPETEAVPGGHFLHAEGDLAPRLGLKVSGRQGSQRSTPCAPGNMLNVPGGQGMHDVEALSG